MKKKKTQKKVISMEDIKVRYCKFHVKMDTCEYLFEQHQLGKDDE